MHGGQMTVGTILGIGLDTGEVLSIETVRGEVLPLLVLLSSGAFWIRPLRYRVL